MQSRVFLNSIHVLNLEYTFVLRVLSFIIILVYIWIKVKKILMYFYSKKKFIFILCIKILNSILKFAKKKILL